MDKLKLWQKREVNYMRDNYSKMSTKDIAIKLARPIGSVYDFAFKEGLIKNSKLAKEISSANGKQQANAWSKKQEGILTTNFIKGLSFKELAVLIGKSWQSCQKKAKKIGLSKYMKVNIKREEG